MTPLPQMLRRLCAEGRVLLGGNDIAIAPTESAFASESERLPDGRPRLIVSLESQDEHGGLLSAVEFTPRSPD